MSGHGAACLIAADVPVSVAQTGVLSLPAAGRAGTPFEVRTTDGSGLLHVRFVADKMDPAFAAAVARMTRGPAKAGTAWVKAAA